MPLLALLMSPSLPTVASAAEHRPVVVVFDMEDTRTGEQKLSPDKLRSMTDYLATKLAIGGKFKVVPRESVHAAIEAIKKGSYKECYDTGCQIEIGRELAAQIGLSTKIDSVGGECLVASRLYDLRQSVTVDSASYRGPCGESEVLTAIEQIAAELRGDRPRRADKNIRFDTSGLPAIPVLQMPSESDAAVSGVDFSNVDVETMEVFDAAVKAEKDDSVPVEEKIALWQEVEKKAPAYQKHASERIIAWNNLVRQKKQIEAIQRKRAARLMKDWEKLQRLQLLSVISDKDKLAWNDAFFEAYQEETKSNPYVEDPAVSRFISAWKEEKQQAENAKRQAQDARRRAEQAERAKWNWASVDTFAWGMHHQALVATYSTTALLQPDDPMREIGLIGVSFSNSYYEFEFALGAGWQSGDDMLASADTGFLGRLRFGIPLISWPSLFQHNLSFINLSGGVETFASVDFGSDDPFRYGLGVWGANTIWLWKTIGVRADFSKGLYGTKDMRIGFSILHYDDPVHLHHSGYEVFPEGGHGGWGYRGVMFGAGFSGLIEGEEARHVNRLPLFVGVNFKDLPLEFYGGFGPMWGTAEGKNYMSGIGKMYWMPLTVAGGSGLITGLALLPIYFDTPWLALIPVGLIALSTGVSVGTFEFDLGVRLFSIPGFDIAGGAVVGIGSMAEYEKKPSQAFKNDDPEFYYDLGVYLSNTLFFTDFFGIRFKYVYSFLNAIDKGHRFEIATVFSVDYD